MGQHPVTGGQENQSDPARSQPTSAQAEGGYSASSILADAQGDHRRPSDSRIEEREHRGTIL